MKLEEINDGEFFIYRDRIFKKTNKSMDYKIIAVSIYDGNEYLFDRDVDVKDEKGKG